MVAATLALAAVERGAAPHRDEHVLQRGAALHVRVHVAGRDRVHLQRLGEVAELRIPSYVAALVRPLQLDEEVVAAEHLREPGGRIRVADRETLRARSRRGRRARRAAPRSRRGSSDGGTGSRFSFGRVPACAAVTSRQRFA